MSFQQTPVVLCLRGRLRGVHLDPPEGPRMTHHRRRAAALISAAAVATVSPILASSAYSSSSGGPGWTAVSANPKTPGVPAPDVLSPELAQVVAAQGAMKLENGTAAVPYYGYDGDKPTLVPLPSAPTAEAHKTEPDKNTYLTFKHGLPGADSQYDYGRHFLFQ